MNSCFPIPQGGLQIRDYYVNNPIRYREMLICIPANEWSEFEGLPLYQELKENLAQVYSTPQQGIEDINHYVNNTVYCRELSICIPAEKWNEFEASVLYQGITRYLEGLRQKIQDSNTAPHAPECTQETLLCAPPGGCSPYRAGFWHRARSKHHPGKWR